MRKEVTMEKENTSMVQQGFKCPYCFRKIMPDGVAFRAMTAYSPQDLEDDPDAVKAEKMIYALREDELYENFWRKYPGSKPVDTESHRTYERYPVISPYDDRYITEAKFRSGEKLIFRRDEDHFLNEVIDTEGNSSKIRICPHCHNRLPFEFGKYPVKYISVVGITSSGKTIFLSQLLRRIKEILARVDMTVAGLCPEADEFVRGHTIRMGQNLPGGNATNVLTTPVPINVKRNKTGERYTLVFYDIAGENCVQPEQMEKYGQFIVNADGIIMIMDPKQFTDLIYIPEEEGEDIDAYSPDRVVDAMYNAFVSANSAGGKSSIPLAAALSKSDLLKGHQDIGDHRNMFQDIPYGEYSQKGFPYDDWNNISTEVWQLLSRKSIKGEILDNGLKQFFPRHSYFAFPALGGRPRVAMEGGQRRYQIDISAQPKRIEEPLYWILYEFGLIEKVRKRGQEDPKSRGIAGGLFHKKN